MIASLTISGLATGVSVTVPEDAGGVGNSQDVSVAVQRHQIIGITLDSGGDEYEGVAIVEIEME